MADEQTTTEQTAVEGADAQLDTTVTTDTAVDTSTEPTGTTDDSSSDPDGNTEQGSDDVAEWARKKGLPLSEQPTENELKLARMQREAEQKMHQATQRTSTELEDAYKESIDDITANNPDISVSDARLAKIEAEVAVSKFFTANPDAVQYESDMAKLVVENPARRNLPLNDLYELAKVRSGTYDNAAQEGGRKALETLAQKQKATAPRGNAVSSNPSSGTITRAMINEKIQQGDDQWLSDNNAEINRLVAEGRLQ